MPSEAARNGDYALPTVFLSVQSDEFRHIGNGHSMLMAMINDPANHQLLERDLKYAFWQNHAIVDAAIGTFIEYGTTNRDKNKESYAELWHRWIYEDYYRTYMLPLEKYGIKIHHDDVAAAWDRIVKKNYVHKTAQFFTVGWSVNFWRIEAQTEQGLRVVRAQISRLVRRIRRFLEMAREAQRSRRDQHPLQQRGGLFYPHRCWSCMVPCLIREDFVLRRSRRQDLHLLLAKVAAGPTRWRSPPNTKAAPTPAMGRFSGRREWEDCYHGWDVADAIKDLGFVRPDGKTMIAQPHLRFDAKDMWTLDHVRGHSLAARSAASARSRRSSVRSQRPTTARASRSILVTER